MDASFEALAVLLEALRFLAVAARRVGRVLDFRSESFRVLLERRTDGLVAFFRMREVVVAVDAVAALAPSTGSKAVAVELEASAISTVAGLVALYFAVWCVVVVYW